MWEVLLVDREGSGVLIVVHAFFKKLQDLRISLVYHSSELRAPQKLPTIFLPATCLPQNAATLKRAFIDEREAMRGKARMCAVLTSS